MKVCIKCQHNKPLAAYPVRRGRVDNRCQECWNARRRQLRAGAPIKTRATAFDIPEDGEPMTQDQRKRRILLGLELSRRHSEPGTPRSLEDIASFCGVSREAIRLIEQSALAKVFRALARDGHKDWITDELRAGRERTTLATTPTLNHVQTL